MGQAQAAQQASMVQPQRQMKQYPPGGANARVPNPANGQVAAGAAGGIVPNGTGAKPMAPKKLAIDAVQLATCTPQQQKQMLGVELAGRITGMLLELDNSDLMDMLGAHDDGGEELKKKVDEAVAVIKAHAAREAVTS